MAKMSKEEAVMHLEKSLLTAKECEAIDVLMLKEWSDGTFDGYICAGCAIFTVGIIGRFGPPLIAKIFKR